MNDDVGTSSTAMPAWFVGAMVFWSIYLAVT